MSCTKQEPVEVTNRGEVMLLAYYQRVKAGRQQWQPVIYIGPPDEPNNAAEIFLGDWRPSLRKAQISGLSRYFELYEERYGFVHPEDPRKRMSGPLPYNVVVLTNNDSFYESSTADPDARA